MSGAVAMITLANDTHVFEILAEEGFITSALSEKLQDAKKMRNVLAHYYGRVNDSIVFTALRDELITDVRAFITQVENVV